MTAKKSKYRYYLKENYTYFYDFSPLFINTDNVCIKTEWGEIYSDKIIIYKNYAWNGASGHVWQGKEIEQKDYPIANMPILQEQSEHMRDTTVATIVHDFLYQFLYEISKITNLNSKIVRKFADLIFYHILIQFNFCLSGLYYKGVRLFGKLWQNISSIFNKEEQS